MNKTNMKTFLLIYICVVLTIANFKQQELIKIQQDYIKILTNHEIHNNK